jgi:uncharacterized protein (DUF1778 family)
MNAIAKVRDNRTRGTINLRAPEETKNLIDRAAKVTGKTRTEFILDSARRTAEDVLLDQRLFVLDAEKYDTFLNLLDEPPKPTAELRRLLSEKSPWEK